MSRCLTIWWLTVEDIFFSIIKLSFYISILLFPSFFFHQLTVEQFLSPFSDTLINSRNEATRRVTAELGMATSWSPDTESSGRNSSYENSASVRSRTLTMCITNGITKINNNQLCFGCGVFLGSTSEGHHEGIWGQGHARGSLYRSLSEVWQVDPRMSRVLCFSNQSQGLPTSAPISTRVWES